MTPTNFGRYIVTQPLPSGGMADLYLAHDPRLRRDVVIKVPKVERLSPAGRERFEREARAVAGLAGCPEIVTLYDFGEQDGAPYLVMRYMSGGTLDERIEQGTFSLEQAAPVIERVAAALDYAHGRGIVHRDVKPANILFDADGNPYLSDFGIATEPDPDPGDETAMSETRMRLTAVGSSPGTQGYRSPEQALGEDELDGRSDVYSLGIVLFEMLAGKVPPQARLPLIADYRDDLPPAAQQLFDRALAKEREARYAAASELAADLRALSAGRDPAPAAVIAPPAGKPPSLPPAPPVTAAPKRPAGGLWLLALVGVVALGASLFALLGRDDDDPPALSPTVEIVVVTATEAATATVKPTEPVTSTATATATVTATAEPPTPTPTAEPPTATPTPPQQPDEIVFQSIRDGDYEIYIMNVDGGNVRQLTHNNTDDNFPRVSPDGRQIVFVSERDGNDEIYVMNRDGSAQTRLTFDPGQDRLPAWSPDGSEIVFQSSRDGLMDIFMMNADGSNVRQITDSPLREGHTSWSPDGRRLAYNASMELYWQLYVSNADGTDVRKITNSTYDEWSPEWSPDGEWILFHSERDNRTNPGIYMMRPDGSDARLIYNSAGEEWGASWSADGRYILFAIARNATTDDLYIMDADGGNIRPLNQEGAYPSWAVGGATAEAALPFFMVQRLTAADLQGLSQWELDLMRNEIFARHGRGFNRADLQSYFDRQPWYTRLYNPANFPTDRLLTEVQKYNAELILNYQQ